METPFVPLEDLVTSVEPLMPGVDLPTTLIANVPPQTLRTSLVGTMLENWSVEYSADDTHAEYAEHLLEKAVRQPYARAVRKQAREYLEKVLADQARYQQTYPTVQLAKSVEAKKFQLAKPFRWLSTIACAVVVGSGMAYGTYEAASASNHRAVQELTQFNETQPPESKLQVPSESLDGSQEFISFFLGVMGMSAGGVIGAAIGTSRLTDRVAQRRAQKLVSSTTRSRRSFIG